MGKLLRWTGMLVGWCLVGFYLLSGHPFPTTLDAFNAMATEIGLAWIVITVAITIYFTPTAIAKSRKHKNVRPIIVVNLFLGWTLVGWVVALSWALSSDVKPEPAAERAKEKPETSGPISAGARFCQSCGAATAPASRFCGTCGQALELGSALGAS